MPSPSNQFQQQSNPISQSISLSDSDDDIFNNLAPITSTRAVISSITNQHNKLVLAKMKRLIGPSFNSNQAAGSVLMGSSVQSSKQNNSSSKTIVNQKQTNKKAIISSSDDEQQSKLQSQNQSISQPSNKLSNPRQRSRDNNKRSSANTASTKKLFSQLDAAILSIQKRQIHKQIKQVKQNDRFQSNKIQSKKNSQFSSDKKIYDTKKTQQLQKFAEMQKLLFVPVEELPVLRKTSDQIKEEKREKKRLDRILDKKYKQYKVGKVKDQASNCVFNGIEDYFN